MSKLIRELEGTIAAMRMDLALLEPLLAKTERFSTEFHNRLLSMGAKREQIADCQRRLAEARRSKS